MVFFLVYPFLLDQLLPPVPIQTTSGFVWETIATIFGGILLWLFKRDLDKRDKREEKMTEAINTLRTELAVLSNGFDGMRNDLDKLLKRK